MLLHQFVILLCPFYLRPFLWPVLGLECYVLHMSFAKSTTLLIFRITHLSAQNSSSQGLPWKRCKSDPLGSASESHKNSMALQLCRSTHVFAGISRTNVQSELAYLKMWHNVAPWQNLVKNSQINGLSISSSVLHHILDLCRLLYFTTTTSKLPSL